MVQAVFQHGRLIASHASLRVLEGADGGAAIKESIEHASIRGDLEHIGTALGWNGALSLDAILSAQGPLYIDINPRLVEPMNAELSGVRLVDGLLSVASGDTAAVQPVGSPHDRTHQGLLVLLGAARTGRRSDVLRAAFQLSRHGGPFESSTEELTPVAGDWRAWIPVGV